VAYIDPGNYSTDVTAGATYRFRLLFVVLMSNIVAIFLQSLCIKLGSVTGLNLAEACRAFLPKWLNIFLYIMAEAAVSICYDNLIAALMISRSSQQILPRW
jgi:metal iron transporter